VRRSGLGGDRNRTDDEDMADDVLALIDDHLTDDVARCAAAAGYRLVRADPASCRREWLGARAVIVDAAAIGVLATCAPPKRAGIVVVGSGPDDVHWPAAIGLGADHTVALPGGDAELVRVLSDIRRPRRHPGAAIAVIGGHGGSGASVLAAATALRSADGGAHTMLFDVDDHGGGVDLLLGIEATPGLRWQDLTVERGAVGGDALTAVLPRQGPRLSVLAPRKPGGRNPGTGDHLPIRPESVVTALDAATAHGTLVVVDTPRAATPLRRLVIDSVDLVVVVTTASLHAVSATRAMLPAIVDRGADTALVVRGPSPAGLRAGAIADAVGLDLLASYRPDPRLPARLESDRLRAPGRGRPLRRACDLILARAAHHAPARHR